MDSLDQGLTPRREDAPTSEIPDPVRSAFVMAVRIMAAGRASLLLKHETENVLTIAAAVGIKTDVVETVRVEYGTGIAGIVAARGLSLFGRGLNNETFLVTPIVTREGIEGVLSLTERLGGRQYTGNDLASTSYVASHIGDLLEYRRGAQIDVVSGLPNRRAFDEALQRELARSVRSTREFSVVFIDLDALKQVNDQRGHAAGDRLIAGVGAALKRAIRKYDFAARIGGDEFGVILADTHNGETGLASRVLARAGAVGSISVGIARFPRDGKTAQDLLSAADMRMYEYKNTHSRGRDRGGHAGDNPSPPPSGEASSPDSDGTGE